MPTIGPTLPPSLSTKRKADTASPTTSPPPKRQRSSTPPTSPPKRRQQIGPAPPPADLSTLSPTDADSPSSSSDDDFGPSLPPADPSTLPTNPPPRDIRAAEKSPKPPPKPAREEWMLLPPTADGLSSSRMDPTKLKNRKFQTGKGASAPSSTGAKSSGISTVWTETPAEKRQRLEDEVLGRKRPAALADDGVGAGGGEGGEDRARRKLAEEKDREAERRVREYNEVNKRGGALMDEGRWTGAGGGEKEGGGGGKERVEEDDPSKRAFDREKDMKVGGAVGYAQKREMLSKARNMGDRFAKGSYL